MNLELILQIAEKYEKPLLNWHEVSMPDYERARLLLPTPFTQSTTVEVYGRNGSYFCDLTSNEVFSSLDMAKKVAEIALYFKKQEIVSFLLPVSLDVMALQSAMALMEGEKNA